MAKRCVSARQKPHKFAHVASTVDMDARIGDIENRESRVENREMPTKTRISSLSAPAAIGPYAQAVRVGDLLYTSGQVALDPQTGELLSGNVTAQTERVCENLRAVLNEANLNFTHVVKTTVFLKDMGDFAAMNAVYARYFAPPEVVPPARSTVQVAALPKGALVEIECIAMDNCPK